MALDFLKNLPDFTNITTNGAPSGGQDINLAYQWNSKNNPLVNELKNSPKNTLKKLAQDPGLKPPSNWSKFNNFAGGTAGQAINVGTSLIANAVGNRTYEGKEGHITQDMDAAYDTVQSAISNIPGWGQAAGMIMGANKMLNNVMSKIGGGTDGVTKTDAILGSAFLAPIGWINGFGGKTANTYTRNQELDANTNGGFQGFLTTQNQTEIGAGKKYGLFSRGAMNKQNKLTEFTQNMKHTVSGIVDANTINTLAAQGSTPFVANQQSVDIGGGVQQMRAARRGMKIVKGQMGIPKIKPIKQTFKKTFNPKQFGPEGMIQMYDKDGNPTRGLTYAQEQGWEPVVKSNGTAGFIGYDSNPALPYMKSARKDLYYGKQGMKFEDLTSVRRALSLYKVGNKLKRTSKTANITSDKCVEVPKGQEGIVAEQRIPSLADFMEQKILKRTEAAIQKAISRKTPYMFKNPNWKNCIATATDNFGIPIVMRNVDLAEDPNKYGFEELQFGDNTDSLPDGVLIQDYNNPKNRNIPGHTIMLVGRTESGAPIYSYSSGDNNANSMHNQTRNYSFYWTDTVKPRAYRYIGTPAERESWEKEYYTLYPQQVPSQKQGGKVNVIPEGALHARLHHLDEVDETLNEKNITTKGIPVITQEEGGEIVQHAEIEREEIIFNIDVTNKLEKLRKEDTDESAIEAGKLLVDEIMNNTIDNTGNLI